MREMKDSGYPWLGDIPRGWIICRIKNLFIDNKDGIKVGPFGSSLGSAVVSEDEGQYKIYGQANLIRRDFEYGDNYVKEEDYHRLIGYKVLPGDITVSMMGTIGKCSVVPDNIQAGIMDSHLIKIRLKSEFVPKYFEYLYESDAVYTQLLLKNKGSIMTGLNSSIVKGVYFIEPPLDEQQAIVDFLDSKCAEIDALSEDIQKEIETLEAYKKSVITEAVTKGLDPDVEMKDSGIEWVGKIPATWEIHPVYCYFGERKNKNYALQEQNLLSLSYGKIIRKDIDTAGGLLPASFNTYNIVEADDIIIRPTDLQNDKRSLRTGLVTERGIITSAYINLAPKGDINSQYFHYLLHSYDVQKVFYNMGNGVRQGLNYSEFSKMMVFSPTRAEQDEIVVFLNQKCDEIETIIADKQKQLEVLAEYKKSVIYEYVTGKKEV